jgi:hypothetical protein
MAEASYGPERRRRGAPQQGTRTHGGHALLQRSMSPHLSGETPLDPSPLQDLSAPSIRPLKKSFCANAKATMPGTTTIT